MERVSIYLIYFSSGINLLFKDVHNSWLYCFINPFELGTRVLLSHRVCHTYG